MVDINYNVILGMVKKKDVNKFYLQIILEELISIDIF